MQALEILFCLITFNNSINFNDYPIWLNFDLFFLDLLRRDTHIKFKKVRCNSYISNNNFVILKIFLDKERMEFASSGRYFSFSRYTMCLDKGSIKYLILMPYERRTKISIALKKAISFKNQTMSTTENKVQLEVNLKFVKCNKEVPVVIYWAQNAC